MTDETELMVIGGNALMPAMTIAQVIERRNLVVQFVRRAMIEGTDFGKIPGTDKPTLLKPGAEKLMTLFGLTPRFIQNTIVKDWTGAEHGGEPFFEFDYKCQLYSGNRLIAEGDGSCNSWEKKYRYRQSERVCPTCGKATIFKSKRPGEGYYCWAKKGGCGATFPEQAEAITSQQVGQVPNPDVADQVNTFEKMAQKRACIAAALLAVNASEFFTQDMEEHIIDIEPVRPEPPAGQSSAPASNDEFLYMSEDSQPPIPQQPEPPPGYVPPAPSLKIQSHENGNGHASKWPAPLTKVYNAAFKYQSTEQMEKARGFVTGKLDEMAGDVQHRHSLLMAWFGVDSSRKLTDAHIKALTAWLSHPDAQKEIDKAIKSVRA